MKLVRAGLCVVLGFSLAGCGGGDSEGAAPETGVSLAAEIDPATWVREKCPLTGWRYDDGTWVLSQAALTPSTGLDSEDRPRVYSYDELNGQVQAVSFVSGPVCYVRPAEGGDAGGVSAVDIATGDDVQIMQVETPQGLAWVDKPDWGRQVFELTYREGKTYEIETYTPVNQYNDLSEIRADTSEAPEKCVIFGCSS